uniref:Chromosome 10 open reading frame 53 n=1 Tax=Latimeria chalumnae TaxID=7897 RepID=H3AUN3_LATCH|nr:PREDICTED: UPF0728 protein C10orf53 homolog [Latimeria chalumnae]XP_014341841.1 PREDICTED: UPF0728 protein C10orf53 homolog [Latimeria chalumnae]|eukprot:XP_005992480.1 PREDICTED: UPF0728 protein C10orf53 homolog [Latimeria chalumnae]
MPKKALVFIRYGPYESCGLVEYRTFRLQGLQTMLHKEGHRCVLQEILDWDTVELIVNGEKIFQCNIKNLEFGNHFSGFAVKSTTSLLGGLLLFWLQLVTLFSQYATL